MAQLQLIFDRVLKAKQEQKELKAMYKDALSNSSAYQRALENNNLTKEEKKKIETGIKEEFAAEFDKLEVIKNEIETDTQLMSDIALSQVAKGEKIEIKDQYENQYEPIFKVKFKKIS